MDRSKHSALLLPLVCLLFCSAALAQFGKTVHYFPQYAIDGGARTLITMHNPGETALTVDVRLTRSDGSSYLTDQVTVQPGATEVAAYGGDSGTAVAGWVQLTSDTEFVATLFYRITGVGNVGVLPSPEAKAMKVITYVGGMIDTGFAVANPSHTEGSDLTFEIYNAAGQLQREVAEHLDHGEHRAFFFSESPYLAQGRGMVNIRATNPVVALALRTDGSLLAGVGVVVPGLPIRGEWTDESPNIIGGYRENRVRAGMVGGTIGGGGNHSSTDPDGGANFVTGSYGTVGGGANNTADFGSSVGGGKTNTASGGHSTVGGGGSNTAAGGASTVGGGLANTASGTGSAVVGGGFNSAIGEFSTVGGGNTNIASGDYSATGGGHVNTAHGDYSTVGGGSENNASGVHSTLSGGERNVASGCSSTVSGGHGNVASGEGSTVGGGGLQCSGVTVAGNTASGESSTVAGGVNNHATGDSASITGGAANRATGFSSTVPGGHNNTAGGNYSLAAGDGAQALHDGTFVWDDDLPGGGVFSSTAPAQFLIRAGGGVGINTNSPQGDLDVNGTIYQRGSQLHADYVFEPDYRLESIEEHSRLMWREKHLPALGPGEKNEEGQDLVEYGSRIRGMLEELEKAHVYIEQLHRRLQQQEKAIADLRAAVANR